MEMTTKAAFPWGKIALRTVLAVFISVVIYFLFAIYQFFNPPVPAHDEIQVGTKLIWESKLEIADRGTHFPKDTPLTMLLKYAKPPGEGASGTASVKVTHKGSAKVMLEDKWNEQKDTQGKQISLGNQTWVPGSYLIQFYRNGKLADEMELVLE
jgi:hypothetical protein